MCNFHNKPAVRQLDTREIDSISGAGAILPAKINVVDNFAANELKQELLDFIKKTRTALPGNPFPI